MPIFPERNADRKIPLPVVMYQSITSAVAGGKEGLRDSRSCVQTVRRIGKDFLLCSFEAMLKQLNRTVQRPFNCFWPSQPPPSALQRNLSKTIMEKYLGRISFTAA